MPGFLGGLLGGVGRLVSSVAPSLVGGMFGLAQQREANKGTDLVQLRDSALRAGFNPLTVLTATGGAGFQRNFSPDLASGAFVADAVARGLDTVFNRPSVDRAAEQIRQSQFRRDAAAVSAVNRLPRPFGYSLTSEVAGGGGTGAVSPALSGVFSPRPVSRPVTVHDYATGRDMSIPSRVAERLGLSNGDAIIAEDFEAIGGDLAGEAQGLIGAVGSGGSFGLRTNPRSADDAPWALADGARSLVTGRAPGASSGSSSGRDPWQRPAGWRGFAEGLFFPFGLTPALARGWRPW